MTELFCAWIDCGPEAGGTAAIRAQLQAAIHVDGEHIALELDDFVEDHEACVRIVPSSRTPYVKSGAAFDVFADLFGQAVLGPVFGYRFALYGMEVDGGRTWSELQPESEVRAAISPPGLVLNDQLATDLRVTNMTKFSAGYRWTPYTGSGWSGWLNPGPGVRKL